MLKCWIRFMFFGHKSYPETVSVTDYFLLPLDCTHVCMFAMWLKLAHVCVPPFEVWRGDMISADPISSAAYVSRLLFFICTVINLPHWLCIGGYIIQCAAHSGPNWHLLSIIADIPLKNFDWKLLCKTWHLHLIWHMTFRRWHNPLTSTGHFVLHFKIPT